MSSADEEMSASDQALMKALREAIGEPRPPVDLVARCEGLLGWIDVDAELAELLAEPLHELAGTRGEGAATGLEFSVADGSCVIEVDVGDDAVRGQILAGELHGDPIVVRTTSGATRTFPVDELGAFVLDDPPRGTVRLEIALTEGRRIHTDWFVI